MLYTIKRLSIFLVVCILIVFSTTIGVNADAISTNSLDSELQFNWDETDTNSGNFNLSLAEDKTLTITNSLARSAGKTVDDVLAYWRFGDDMYSLLNSNKIIKYNLVTNVQQTIYEDLDTLERVYLDPNLVFFMKDSAIYRLYIATGQVDKVYSSTDLVDFSPISSMKIIVTEPNPEYIHYVEESSDNENYPGLPETIQHIYNIGTGEKADYIPYRGTIDNSLASTTTSVSYGSYGPGTYFTRNGGSCALSTYNCHANGYCTLDTTSPNYSKCNCKLYGGAMQCKGYARYVYYQNHGTTEWGDNISLYYANSTKAERAQAASDIKNIIDVTAIGSHIRLANNHSVILTGTTSTGFTVYQCNASNSKCEVTSGSYSYSGIASNYTSITVNE